MRFCRVPSPEFSRSPGNALPAHLCRFAVRSTAVAGLAAFLVGMAFAPSGFLPPRRAPALYGARICLGPAPRRLNKLFHPLARITFPVPASHAAVGTGILTRFPSGARLRFPLGADSPCAVQRGAGNLGLTATRILFLVLATHVNIRSSNASKAARAAPSSAYGTLPYQSLARFRGFGCGLEPRYIFRAGRLDR